MAQTHYRKLMNPDYLGAYALEPGKDIILTIKHVKTEQVVGPDGKKEECVVMYFSEPSKPMILNSTNAKTIEKLFKTPYIEEWSGRQIQIGAERVKAFGDVVEALRVRNKIPQMAKVSTVCADCKGKIAAFDDKHDAEWVAKYTHGKYGKPLCSACAEKQTDVTKVEDPLA